MLLLLLRVSDWHKWIHCPCSFLWAVESSGQAEHGSWDKDFDGMDKVHTAYVCAVWQRSAFLICIECAYRVGLIPLADVKVPKRKVDRNGLFDLLVVYLTQAGCLSPSVSPCCSHTSAVGSLYSHSASSRTPNSACCLLKSWHLRAPSAGSSSSTRWVQHADGCCKECCPGLLHISQWGWKVQRGWGCWSPVTDIINSAIILCNSEKINADIVQMWTKVLGFGMAVLCNLFLGVITFRIIIVVVRVEQ